MEERCNSYGYEGVYIEGVVYTDGGLCDLYAYASVGSNSVRLGHGVKFYS